MARFGNTLWCEGHGPKELVAIATRSEEAGFDFAAISDHFHPWLPEHGHSPFAWSVLGAVAQATERIELATMVTCPFVRYHPAIVAQAAATVAVLSDGRFTLGLGAGERLNEHVVGAGWPSVDVRHEMLEEAIEIIRHLWTGEYVTYRGDHLDVEDARIFDLPPEPIDVFVGAGGPQAAALAADAGNGLCATEPMPDLVEAFTEAGGDRADTWSQIPISWHADEAEAVAQAKRRFRFGVAGWKVMSELPNPVNFAAATETVRDDDITEMIPCGPDPELHVERISRYVDAGFERVALAYVGDDLDGFLTFWERELRPRLGS